MPDKPLETKDIQLAGEAEESRLREDATGDRATQERLTREGQDKAREDSARLVEKGTLPATRITFGEVAPGIKQGQTVQHANESWKALGAVNEKVVVLYQEGRGATFANQWQRLTGPPDPAKYVEIKFEGQPKGRSYYADKNGVVYTVSDMGPGFKFMGMAHDVKLASTKQLAAENGMGRPAPPPPEGKREANQPVEKKEAPAPVAPSDRPGTKVEVKDHPTLGKVEERSRTIDGAEVKVKTPTGEGRDMQRRFQRIYEVNGKEYALELKHFPQQWMYSAKNGTDTSHVKLHVTAVSPEDMARIQKELIPMLSEAVEKGDAVEFKTHDPNYMDKNWDKARGAYGSPPSPTDQGAKDFTVYVPAHKAKELAAKIDKLLVEKGLVLEGHPDTGNVADSSRLRSGSRRVSLERDMWTPTYDKIGQGGALLDKELADKAHAEYKKYGVEADGKLNSDALRQLEKDCGMMRNQLTYDTEGRLMFASRDSSKVKSDGRYYATEGDAIKTEGRKTGRPALYALYDKLGVEPAETYLEKQQAIERTRRSASPAGSERVEREAERETRGNEEAKPGERKRPSRGPAPTRDGVERVATEQNPDGTQRRSDSNVGRTAGSDKQQRERLSETELAELKRELEELKKSTDAEKREAARQLEETIKMAEGRYGADIQRETSRGILERMGEGKARAAVGAGIGVGILAAAALAWWVSKQEDRPQEPLKRATFTGNR